MSVGWIKIFAVFDVSDKIIFSKQLITTDLYKMKNLFNTRVFTYNERHTYTYYINSIFIFTF